MPSSPVFKMTVDLNVLDHLADGLYSSVAAVLTETVANAWDADSKRVDITLDIAGDKITICDNGIGMDQVGVNERYLRVGYRRRNPQNGPDVTPGGRPVMGRKGIGKLSLFSISDIIQIKTKPSNTDAVGLKITVSKLREDMIAHRSEYNPDPLQVVNTDFPDNHGTQISISSLKRDRLQDMAPESLRRRLARRFTVIGSSGFQVFVNGTEVTAADREDIKFAEYIWKFGSTTIDPTACTLKKAEFTFVDQSAGWDPAWRIRGWIGTVDTPKRLKIAEGNLNSVVLIARGRLVDEDVLPRISGTGVYTKYVTGQIEADFLDVTDSPDIVTSNRQSLIEDDARFSKVIAFLKSQVQTISDEWSRLRAKDKTSELRKTYPGVGAWLDGMDAGWKPKAEKLLERIATMELEGTDVEQAESQKTLLRHSIYGFEKLRLRGNAEELEQALGQGVEALLSLLSGRDSLEASMYRDIVENRLEVIRELDRLVGEDQKEKVLQQYLFNHLWLLDPSWERATGSEAMEKRLRLNPAFKNDKTTNDSYGRIDIQYKTVAGKHVIVELKRASVNTPLYTLAEQGTKYVEGLKQLIPVDEQARANIEVIFVVGKDAPETPDKVDQVMKSVSSGSKRITYDLLITKATQAYDEYLKSSKKVDRIEEMLKPPAPAAQAVATPPAQS